MVPKISSKNELNSRDAIYGFGKKFFGNGEWNFHNENTQEHFHALHSYPARFIPQIPSRAIKLWTSPGDLILDPFCGCGTTILESSLLGRPSIGVDNNSVAILISKAKATKYRKGDLETLGKFVLEIDKTSRSRKIDLPKYENFDYWFSTVAKIDLGKLKRLINQLPIRPRLLAMAVFSSIIVRVSNQDSDTRYVRVAKEYVPGSALKWYKTKLLNTIDGYNEIINKPREDAKIFHADGRRLNMISDNKINMIITSPPYINAYDYHKYHRHRLHWINGDFAFARDTEIGKHDTFTRTNADPREYFKDMSLCFSEWFRVLKNKGRVLIVIGDGIVNGQPIEVGNQFIQLALDIGFKLKKRWVRDLQTDKKSFNQKARINKEHVLLFQKV